MFDPFPLRFRPRFLGLAISLFASSLLDQTPVRDTFPDSPDFRLHFLPCLVLSLRFQDTTFGLRPKFVFGVDVGLGLVFLNPP
jgi:hypothetical protein